MQTTKQQINDAYDFLHRFLSGERGFTTGDVLAGVTRLRTLEPQVPDESIRVACRSIVQQVCVKLDRYGENWKWSQGPG